MLEEIIYQKSMGNPFIDAGVSVMSQWLDIKPHEITSDDLRRVVKGIVPVFNNTSFKKSLYSIFPNSTFTNNSIRGDRKAKFICDCNKYIDAIIVMQDSGDCLGCGRRNSTYKLGKDKVPLTGSGKLANFFPSFDKGVGYCSACTLAIQFSPLSFVASGGKLLMLSSTSWQAMVSWTKICVKDIRSKMLKGEDVTCYNPGYSNPRNGLFYMAGEMIKLEEGGVTNEDVSMQVFYFTNYNQGPELEIFYLPTPAFRFLRYANQIQYKSAWISIVKSGYQKVNWNKVKLEDDYKNKYNLVYEYLLQERSIIQFFLNQKERKQRGDWELLSLYLKEVRNMSEERIEVIRKVADKIADIIEKSRSDKRLGQLERAGSYREFQNILRFIIKDRLKNDEDECLFTLDEYTKHLFPDGSRTWKETQYLLLFGIYETLHEWLKDKGIIEDENTNQSTEEN